MTRAQVIEAIIAAVLLADRTSVIGTTKVGDIVYLQF